MTEKLLILLLLFQAKHLICDYFLQFPRHFLNKGTYGKWGGIEHAIIHAIPTAIILTPLAGMIDYMVHYHVDWAKMKLGAVKGWKPDNAKFWHALGVDQFLHHVTYIGLIYYYG